MHASFFFFLFDSFLSVLIWKIYICSKKRASATILFPFFDALQRRICRQAKKLNNTENDKNWWLISHTSGLKWAIRSRTLDSRKKWTVTQYPKTYRNSTNQYSRVRFGTIESKNSSKIINFLNFTVVKVHKIIILSNLYHILDFWVHVRKLSDSLYTTCSPRDEFGLHSDIDNSHFLILWYMSWI